MAFNGLPSSRTATVGIIPVEFADPWDLRVQFYPLTIIITLSTLPFAYLITKIFKSDILVRSGSFYFIDDHMPFCFSVDYVYYSY